MFRRLLTIEEVQEIIRKYFKLKPLGVEEISLLEAHNRVLAENITASLDIPPFNRSTVDGYALKAEDTFGAEENKPVILRVCGTVSVGEQPKIKIRKGMATEIMTGAPIPEGADAVVPLEHAEKRDNNLYVYTAVTRDENVMKAGSDIKKGETVLKAGKLLGSREIGVLAALGLAKVKVYRIPKVAVLSTGVEITEPGKKLLPGKIYDINTYSLSTAVLESGGKPVYMGVFPDEKTEMQKALEDALATTDIVITSGGVSVGPKDVIPQILNSLGKPGVMICGIATKPGKPTTVALINDKPVFSLPGHPTSALLIFHLLTRPVLLSMSGRKTEDNFTVRAFSATRIFPAKGRRTFVMVRLSRDKMNRLIAEPVQSGLSGAITTLAKADGFVEIAENQQFIEEGEEVTVRLFSSSFSFSQPNTP
ncbi:MAG: gephyrin-like molybdotransferase Glp [Candidatus Bathyarchaeia archaeon]|nr:MAG: molybdopterin molybdenumtransferase MoeA [Candidatus Bathyarchaeota archaeon]